MHDSRRPARSPLIVAIAVLLAGCGGNFAPFETQPSPSAARQVAPRVSVAVCYNSMFTTPDQVRETAANACGLEGEPHLIGQDMRLSCPLATPVRATFACGVE